MSLEIKKVSELSRQDVSKFKTHMYLFMRPDDEREILATSNADNLEDYLESFDLVMDACGGLGFVGYWNGAPVGAGGIFPLWPGVGSIWMIATTNWRTVANPVTKYAKRKLIPDAWKQGFHRLEARSIEGHNTAHRWMMFLGAKDEARLRNYGKEGQDFIVFSWHPPVGEK